MKKTNVAEMRSEYRVEYPGKGERGKCEQSYRDRTNLVLLSPDVAEASPTEQAVNDALRSLMELVRKTRLPQRSSRRTKEARD